MCGTTVQKDVSGARFF